MEYFQSAAVGKFTYACILNVFILKNLFYFEVLLVTERTILSWDSENQILKAAGQST